MSEVTSRVGATTSGSSAARAPSVRTPSVRWSAPRPPIRATMAPDEKTSGASWHWNLTTLEVQRQLPPRADLELAVGVGEVTLHCLDRDEESLGDLAVGHA